MPRIEVPSLPHKITYISTLSGLEDVGALRRIRGEGFVVVPAVELESMHGPFGTRS